jgi:hypothetical protein
MKKNSPSLLARALFGSAVSGLLVTAQSVSALPFPNPSPFGSQVKHVFVIAMENHNFTQPVPTNSPQQILGNPAAPYLNSLITPGNSNAAHVSYATAYFNAGIGVHPSEPNYIWAEAATDYAIHTDADPRTNNGNVLPLGTVHLTAQLNAAGISWRNYQEDVQLSASPTNSASGTNAPTPNPFYGTAQYNYAVKHNPMAFFTDTLVQNVHPLGQLFADLASNSVARYNWITPNQYNDAHSALNGGFIYQGTHFTGDQASIAQGDNFLSQIIPAIMATPAYQDHGVIIIWWDESEGGDGTNRTIPEIVISPLAKGNAYASSVPLNHSSDIKTMSEIFGLADVNNAIPSAETDATGVGYNYVALVNDLSDLFLPGVIPQPRTVSVHGSEFFEDPFNHHVFQFVEISNTGSVAIPAPLFLVLDNLGTNATLLNAQGVSSVLAPLGSPYVSVRIPGFEDRPLAGFDSGKPEFFGDFLLPHETAFVVLEFLDSTSAQIQYDARVLSVTPAP